MKGSQTGPSKKFPQRAVEPEKVASAKNGRSLDLETHLSLFDGQRHTSNLERRLFIALADVLFQKKHER